MAGARVKQSRAAALLQRHTTVLEETCGMRFIREASGGTLAADDLARYLLIEEDFVLTASRVLGRVVWESATWEGLVPHARSLFNLVGGQLEYFAAQRARRPVPEGTGGNALAQARVLSDTVLAQVEEHGRSAAVTGMLAAEELYARWCTAAAQQPVTRDPVLRDWIDLHAAPPFLAQVDALRADVDTIDPVAVPDEALDDWFTAVLHAEVTFHDAAYAS